MNEPKWKPENPLPWYELSDDIVREIPHIFSEQDAKYLIHACNAYPKLVEFVKECALHSMQSSYAEDLLRELGELP